MIPILPVGKIIRRKVCARHYDLVVDAIELHVLQSPSFVETFWHDLLFKALEVGGVVHPDFDAGGEFVDERGEEGGGRRVWGFAGAAEGIGENGDFEVGVETEGLRDCVNLWLSEMSV